MAGKRQHILPRFLLKGFVERRQGKEAYTFVYKRDREPYKTNINNVSVEGEFYGKTGKGTTDDRITKLEPQFDEMLKDLRQKDDQTEIFDKRIAEFIGHLCIRTKHLRDSFRESTEYILKKLMVHVSDPENVKKIMLNRPELIKQSIEKEFNERKIPSAYHGILRPMIEQMVPNLLESQKSEMASLFRLILNEVIGGLKNAITEGQIKVLRLNPVPEVRIESYRTFRWFVYKSTQPLILGDYGCLFEIQDTKNFKSITVSDEVIENIFLPIASDRLLVGVSKSPPSAINMDRINQTTAKCCKDFFISPCVSSNLHGFAELIGSESEMIGSGELDRMVGDLIAEEFEKGTP